MEYWKTTKILSMSNIQIVSVFLNVTVRSRLDWSQTLCNHQISIKSHRLHPPRTTWNIPWKLVNRAIWITWLMQPSLIFWMQVITQWTGMMALTWTNLLLKKQYQKDSGSVTMIGWMALNTNWKRWKTLWKKTLRSHQIIPRYSIITMESVDLRIGCIRVQ